MCFQKENGYNTDALLWPHVIFFLQEAIRYKVIRNPKRTFQKVRVDF